MGEAIFGLLHELDHSTSLSRCQPSHHHDYTSPLVPKRDRYRVHRPPTEGVYDIEEDEGGEHGADETSCSFGQTMLQLPGFDELMKAEQGRVRPSFAPNASKFLTREANSEVQTRPSYDDSEAEPGHSAHHMGLPEVYHGDIFRHAPRASRYPLGPSSFNSQSGAPFNPAFRASEKDEHTQPHMMLSKMHKSTAQYVQEKRDHDGLHSRMTQSVTRNELELPHAAPMAQGIPLVPVTELPDRLRTVFPFPVFHAMQSKCFKHVFESDVNFVLSSPTGSGKTAILELAICRAINRHATGQYKIIYQAPTRALCSERQRDWQKKFNQLGLQCVELTSDSNMHDLRNVQTADIIVTTPEKWDTITRKWKDHQKLMQLIKLFLIDEVHMLRDDRGATLEAVISRMKTIGTDVRYIALSATVPNLEDVATWLGRSPADPAEPAIYEKFGEEFRPVKLRKHVCGYQGNLNDFAFEKTLDSKLIEVVTRYSERKPIMIFCTTRNSCVNTAKMLANWWLGMTAHDRFWGAPVQPPHFVDSNLRQCAASGVAFHHAGLESNDRVGVETGYLEGNLNVICCTSTLAVGVNLPCHFVILKNTVTYTNTGLQEYADLEVMQMLGRAGRPQFDASAIAVIMTHILKAKRYEMMVTGQQMLESCLHLNLIEHMNAEIGLGTVNDMSSAKRWLAGTFLCARLKKNPDYYKLEGSRNEQGLEEQLDDICTRDITLLKDMELITEGDSIKCTIFGHAMSRHYVRFETMKLILNIPAKATISEILSAIAQAVEFREVRIRAGEKAHLKGINKSPLIRFPIGVDIALTGHKVSLILQAVLGGAEIDWGNQANKFKQNHNVETNTIFRTVPRLIRCIIDCKIEARDSIAIRNALLLERSFSAKSWDDSPAQMKQIEQLGIVAVRKLVNHGIRSLEELESTQPHLIEIALGRNPPFGLKILERLKFFPKLRVTLQLLPRSIVKTAEGVRIQVKSDVGFLNENTVTKYRDSAVFVCVLTETSDGRMADFKRIPGHKLAHGQHLILPVLLTSADESVNCYAMCEQIAGTMREAFIKPKIPLSMFPSRKPPESQALSPTNKPERPIPNVSSRSKDDATVFALTCKGTDDFEDDELDDDELVKASDANLDFHTIDDYANPKHALSQDNTADKSPVEWRTTMKRAKKMNSETRQLENGNWACNHHCKDKMKCRHMCCKDGLERPRGFAKKTAKKTTKPAEPIQAAVNARSDKPRKVQAKLQLTAPKRKNSASVEILDLTQQETKSKNIDGLKDRLLLHQLHANVQHRNSSAVLAAVSLQKPTHSYPAGEERGLSYLDDREGLQHPDSRTIGVALDGLSTVVGTPHMGDAVEASQGAAVPGFSNVVDNTSEVVSSDYRSESFGENDSLLEDAMMGIADSQQMQMSNNEDGEALRIVQDMQAQLEDNSHAGIIGEEESVNTGDYESLQLSSSSTVKHRPVLSSKPRSPFVTPTSSTRKSNMKRSAFDEMLLIGDEPSKRRVIGPLEGPVPREAHDSSSGGPVVNESDLAAPDDPKAVVPDVWKELEPWFLEQFGNIVDFK